MFKKVKNRNHVLSQPVRKHIKKHTTQKMVLNHPYRVCLLYTKKWHPTINFQKSYNQIPQILKKRTI